jgi:DNA-directed RNA polymerase subunit K/omega
VETRYKKPTSTALEEISQAKVEYRMKDEGESKT